MSQQTGMGIVQAVIHGTVEINLYLLLECKELVKESMDLLSEGEKVEANENIKCLNILISKELGKGD